MWCSMVPISFVVSDPWNVWASPIVLPMVVDVGIRTHWVRVRVECKTLWMGVLSPVRFPGRNRLSTQLSAFWRLSIAQKTVSVNVPLWFLSRRCPSLVLRMRPEKLLRLRPISVEIVVVWGPGLSIGSFLSRVVDSS